MQTFKPKVKDFVDVDALAKCLRAMHTGDELFFGGIWVQKLDLGWFFPTYRIVVRGRPGDKSEQVAKAAASQLLMFYLRRM